MKNILKYSSFINENRGFFRTITDEDFERFDGNLIDIDNSELTPDGIVEKIKQWQAKEGSVPKWLYEQSKKELDSYGYKIPSNITVSNSVLE